MVYTVRLAPDVVNQAICVFTNKLQPIPVLGSMKAGGGGGCYCNIFVLHGERNSMHCNFLLY